ncbi:hypothetical protein OUHCRE4_28140 [Enterobacter hormaechei subsp. steigerwaltii]
MLSVVSQFNKMAGMIGFIPLIWFITRCLDQDLRTKFAINKKSYIGPQENPNISNEGALFHERP